MTVDLDRQPSGGTADCGRRTTTANDNDDAATATKWVDFPPDFFPSSNRLLRFPSDLEIVSVFFLFKEIFVSVVGSSKMVHGSSFFVRGISVFSMAV